jgi:hypothetical protein
MKRFTIHITKEESRIKERAPIKPSKKIVSKKEKAERRPEKYKHDLRKDINE